jgi:hypothetical protein
MTTDRIERRLPEILTEVSRPMVPDYLDDILSETARARQRPGWSFPERWLPMNVAVVPLRAERVHWRVIGVLALLALAAAAAVYFSSQPRRPAPLFGPAPNGSIVYERDGDIFVADADAGHERLLIGGEAIDHAPSWSLDGGVLFFGRDLPMGTAVMAADANGGDVHRVSATLVLETEWLALSPDATQLAAINLDQGRRTLGIHSLSGDAGYVDLELEGIDPTGYVAWRPPTGDELVFLGHPRGTETDLAMYAIRPDGTGLRPLAVQHHESIGSVAAQLSFQDVAMADDGRQAAYWNWEPSVGADRVCSVHVIDLSTGLEQGRRYDPSARCESRPVFLGDGRILLERQVMAAGDDTQLIVAPIDGGAVTPIGPTFAVADRAAWVVSPDRSEVLFITPSGASRVISIRSGTWRDVALRLPAQVTWQRLTGPPAVDPRPPSGGDAN